MPVPLPETRRQACRRFRPAPCGPPRACPEGRVRPVHHRLPGRQKLTGRPTRRRGNPPEEAVRAPSSPGRPRSPEWSGRRSDPVRLAGQTLHRSRVMSLGFVAAEPGPAGRRAGNRGAVIGSDAFRVRDGSSGVAPGRGPAARQAPRPNRSGTGGARRRMFPEHRAPLQRPKRFADRHRCCRDRVSATCRKEQRCLQRRSRR